MKAPLEKVYAAYTDFEAMPKWAKQVRALRVIGREGSRIRIESEGLRGGTRRVSTEELTLSPPSGVESEAETRFTKTRRFVRLEEVSEGTKVTAVLDVRVKGVWSWILSPRVREDAESSAREALAAFARYVEDLQGPQPGPTPQDPTGGGEPVPGDRKIV